MMPVIGSRAGGGGRRTSRLITGCGWRRLARPGRALEYSCWQWHVPSTPHGSLLEWPGVDRVAVSHHFQHSWFAELVGGPLVEGLKPRHNHRVIEHPAETLLVGDVALHLACEWVAIWQHAAERQERAGHPEPGIAEQATQES